MRKSLCARAVIRSLSSDSDMISGSKEYRALLTGIAACASCLLICEEAEDMITRALLVRFFPEEKDPAMRCCEKHDGEEYS